jgi:hypothetical protein
MAPVADIELARVPELLVVISDRLLRETSPEQAATLWAATQILMGLRYPKQQVEELEVGSWDELEVPPLSPE